MISFKNLKIGPKLIAVFLVVGIVPLLIIGGTSLQRTSKALTAASFEKNQAILNIKKNQITRFVDNMLCDVKILSGEPSTGKALEAFGSAFAAEGRQIGGSQWRAAENDYGPWLSYFKQTYEYYDLFLINASGDVVFTVAKEADLGTNVAQGPLRNSPLGLCFERAKTGPVIVDFAPYAPSNNEPCAFIGAPVMRNGQLIGVAALQISIKDINVIMQERTGMGQTGEVYLVGSDKLMRSDSFLDPTNHSVAASFANPESGKIDTVATREALSGQSGSMIIKGYTGSTLISSYAPLTASGLNWAIVAEISKKEALQSLNAAIKIILGMGIIGAILIVVAALGVSRSITNPIIQSSDLSQKMSEGDFTANITVDMNDEIGVLAGSLNKMADNLRQVMRDIVGGVETLSSSSTELNAISDQMSMGAERSAARANTVAAAAEEMSSNMHSVSVAADQTANNMNIVASSAEEMTATINEIAQNTERARMITTEAVGEAQHASETVNQLGQAAREIGKVSETINEISEQTNLLALNATIEAARAGESGKGFAVVANEIKELAKQAADATGEIKNRIDSIQSSTESTVGRMGQIAHVINEVNEIVATIATAVEEQSVATKEIAINVNQAARGMQEINENVSQASLVSGEIARDINEVNMAAMEMSNSSSQVNLSSSDLSQLAEKLKFMVDRFRV